MKNKQQLLKLINLAAQAPSGHNTQPWKFILNNDEVVIAPDFSRALPHADADNHALYISLGCAMENFCIAATQYGYDTQISYPVKGKANTIRIKLSKSQAPQDSRWFGMITKRQVSRGKYQPQPLSENLIKKLQQELCTDDVQLLFFNGPEQKAKLTPFINRGIEKQYKNKAFKQELSHWMRFSEKAALKSGDGLWASSLGLPSMPAGIGKFVVSHFVSAKSEKKRVASLVEHSGALALLVATSDTALNWIALGRVFQRFGLETTRLGLKHAHLNMPCEEKEIRRQMTEELGLSGHPLLLLRVGQGNDMPYSFRRNIYEIIKD